MLKGEKRLKNKKLLIVILILLIIVVFFIVFKNKILKIIYPRNHAEFVSIYAEKYKIDENLIFAVIKAESNFDIRAVSNKSAIGLMQIMEETAKDVVNKYGVEIDLEGEMVDTREEIANVQNNINIGTKYLSVLLDRYQNKEVAVAAYNAGIGTVDGWIEKGIIKADGTDIENIPYKETNNYVRKILTNYEIYGQLYSK